jgi:hypothetical protein
MFWTWGVGLRRTCGLVRNSTPRHDGRFANRWAYQTLVHLLYILRCIFADEYAVLRAQHSNSPGHTRFRLTNTGHNSGAPLCKGFTGKERRGSALGCAVLPDRHTIQLCTVCTVQYNIPYVHTVIVRTVPYMRRTYLQSDSVRQTETHRSPISHMRHLLQCILYQDEHTTVP